MSARRRLLATAISCTALAAVGVPGVLASPLLSSAGSAAPAACAGTAGHPAASSGLPRSGHAAAAAFRQHPLVRVQPSAQPPLAMGTPTVVDQFRPGFEQDVAVDPHTGQTYTSLPFGFSTTQSFIYRSDDNRASFHLAEGNFFGKPTTCAGGGDTELKVDPVTGHLYFVDLQGLTNLSTSVSTDHGKSWQTNCTGVNGTGVDRQWLGIDTNGGTTGVDASPEGGRLYLDYDNVEQDTDLSNSAARTGDNQLVMNESLDGVHYGGGCTAAGLPCPLPAAVISSDEGIPGNIVVDNNPGSAYEHSVYAVHTNAAGNGVVVSYCRGAVGDTTAAQVAADCTDPTQASPDSAHVNVNWRDTYPQKPGKYTTGNLFSTIAIDTAGNLYAAWSQYPTDSAGTENGPGAIYLAVSTDGARTWSAPIKVSPASLGNNVMPWITAGSPGRVDVAWEGAPQAKNAQGTYGPDTLDAGTWNVYLAQTLDALAAQPSFQVVRVSDHQNKFGNISTQGLGGSPDRSLGDFLQVTTGPQGQAVVSYVDDTSADRNADTCQGCGQTPPEAAGPAMIATQSSGPSLYSWDGTVPPLASPVGQVSDPTGDAYLSQGGRDTAAAANQDITGVSVTQPDATHLRVSMSTADPKLASDLSVSPALGGGTAEWIVRWAAPNYGTTPGDGNIFYVGMESVGGGAPTFYTGTTGSINTTHVKYFTYPQTTAIPGSIQGGTITWTVPLADIGSPHSGDGLYSVTGFTATQLYPSAFSQSDGGQGDIGDENIPNLIDAAPPMTFTVGATPAARAVPAGASHGTPAAPVGVPVPATALVTRWRSALRVGG